MKIQNTQEKWVRGQLKRYGRVTRDEALLKNITRLGAIMCELKKAGFMFLGGYEKTKYGSHDFVYRLVK